MTSFIIYIVIGILINTYIGWRNYNYLILHPVYIFIILFSSLLWPFDVEEFIKLLINRNDKV